MSRAAYLRAVSRRRLSRQEGSQQGEPEGLEPDQIQGGSNKVRLAIVAGIIVIVLIVTLAVYLQPTTATGLSMKLTSGKVVVANSSDVTLAVLLSIHNPTNKNMTYYGASYQIQNDGNNVGSGLWIEHYAMPPGTTRVLNETIDINLGDVIVVTPISSTGTWRLQGTATVSVAGANETQGFDFNFATQ